MLNGLRVTLEQGVLGISSRNTSFIFVEFFNVLSFVFKSLLFTTFHQYSIAFFLFSLFLYVFAYFVSLLSFFIVQKEAPFFFPPEKKCFKAIPKNNSGGGPNGGISLH
jgi:hypothetical protein